MPFKHVPLLFQIVFFNLSEFVVWIQADWAAPRTLLFLGMFCMIACIICVVLRWYIMKDKDFLLFVAAGLSLIAGK